MVWRRTGTIRWALFAALGFLALPVLASPYRGERFAYRQPDGEAITVRLWGDEFYAVEETEDGYVVTRDSATGEFCYARLAPNRKFFVSSGIRVGRGNPEKNGIKPKERLDPGEVDRIQGQRRAERGFDGKGRFLNWGHEKKTADSGDTVLGAPARSEISGGSGIIIMAPPANPTLNLRTGLTIMVVFHDRLGDAVMTSTQISNFLNQSGYSGFGNRGSVFDYFWTNSNGRLCYSNIVVDYWTTAQDRVYYDDATLDIPGKCPLLVSNALEALRVKGFDFSRCDADHDGYVDAVNILYAGSTMNPRPKGLWPHMGTLNPVWTSPDGTKVSRYQISDMGNELTIGTFCHESGHLLCNFPDLYDYNDNLSEGLGNYCLMSTSTGWKQPPKPCVYLAYKAGWVDVVNLNSNSAVTVTARVDNATAWRYANPTNSKEYFMFEYRSSDQPGWEAGGRLPDCGLAVYHVDENGDNRNEANTPASHYECALIQADGLGSLEKNRNPGSPNDLYAWPDNRRLTDTTTPSAKWWDGAISRLDVNNVGPLGSSIVFNVGKAPSVQVASPVSPRTGSTTTTCRVVLEAITNAATSVRWQAVEMPTGGSVSFGSSTTTNTTVIATGAGRYAIRCFAGNGSLEGFDDVVLYVGNNPSPVGHWRMDDANEHLALDSSGYTNDAFCLDSLTYSNGAGQLRAALAVNGTNRPLTVLAHSTIANIFEGGGAFGLWIKPSVIYPTNRILVYKGTVQCYLDGTIPDMNQIGILWFQKSFSGNLGVWNSERIVESNVWTHVAICYDSDSAVNNPSLYVNGRRAGMATAQSPTGTTNSDKLSNLQMLGITTTNSLFKGLVDEVQMFASNLTARETADLALPLDFAPIVNAGTNAGIALRGGTNVYTMRGSAYDPEGDSMTYRWKQASGPGAAAFTNATLTNTMVSFSAVGTYVLRLEANDGDAVGFNEMTMVVTNALPTCSIAAPTNFHIAAEGMAVTVTVTCADADGIVTQVVYFADSIVLGRTTSAPRELAWVNAAIGGHALQAAAYDDSGGVTTSATVSITVEVDTDHDGIPNSQDPDDDNDGMPDDWEIAYGLNPTNASATADSDSDGAPDYWEYIAGTVPTNPVSVLNILDLVLTDAPELKMRIQSVTARWYRLEFSTNLAIPDSWQHRTNQTLGTGNQITLTDTNTASNAVYRVRVWK
jgi:M6 family metalloprotease-like protein